MTIARYSLDPTKDAAPKPIKLDQIQQPTNLYDAK
jgi:hypothetical protein